MLSLYPGSDELVLDVDAVGNVNAKHQSLSPLAVLVPIGNNVADQVGTVHPIGELLLGVVSGDGLDALQIRE